MKRIITILCLLIFVSFSSWAQSAIEERVKPDVKMKYIYSFEEALKESKEKNKLIFFNCYGEWAIPCYGMDMKVFSNQEFADWMDQNFVNFFIDVYKGEGKALAKKYNIKTMAQYLVLDANGEVVHRIVGGSEIPEFKKQLERALNPKTNLRAMNLAYSNGDRTPKFLNIYFEVLAKAEEEEKAKLVLNEMFGKIKPKDWSKREYWGAFRTKCRKPSDTYFDYLVKNKATFIKQSGKEAVDKKLRDVFYQQLFPYTMGDSAYNANTFLDLTLAIQRAEIGDNKEIQSLFDFAKARGTGNMAKIIEILVANDTTWDPNFLRYADLSLSKLKALSKEDRAMLTAYWQKRADFFGKISTANHYRKAITKLNTITGIKFRELTYQEALDEAAKEGKEVFLDCFTTWCGPCKWLDANTFLENEVGEYFNANYVSIKIDMEKGEGIELRKKLDVTAFPTMFTIDSKGNVVHKIIGAMDGKKLLSKVQEEG